MRTSVDGWIATASDLGRLDKQARGDGDRDGFRAILGTSEATQRVIARARRVLNAMTTILIEGPTGTGKDLLARAIHYESVRRDRPLIAQNCGAIPDTLLASELFGHQRGAFTGAFVDRKGLFEVAHGGTLFLDEIADASAAVQVHLLRALQDQEVRPVGAARSIRVDVRVIVATNRSLASEVQHKRFREDLYFRLNVFRIYLPPLRERREDIRLLARHFLARHSRRLGKVIAGIDPAALDALLAFDFPGNVRQLDHMIERAVLLAEPNAGLTTADLFDGLDVGPQGIAASFAASLQDGVVAFERERIVRALNRCDGNRTHAARELGITYRGLLKKMRRCGLIANRSPASDA